MANFIVIVILIAIVGSAIAYIVKEKKKGVKCIGCPAGGSCPNSGVCTGCGNGHSGEECGCHTDTKQ